MAGVRRSVPAATEIETKINTGTYSKFQINGNKADPDARFIRSITRIKIYCS